MLRGGPKCPGATSPPEERWHLSAHGVARSAHIAHTSTRRSAYQPEPLRGLRARPPVAGAHWRLRVCVDYTSTWIFDMSISLPLPFTFGAGSCLGPGLCPVFWKKSAIGQACTLLCAACSSSWQERKKKEKTSVK